MDALRIVPIAVLAFSFGAGCHRARASVDAPQQAAAPFAAPPVLPGTPDVATLVAKLRPSVVNITTIHEVRIPRIGGLPDLGELFPFGQGPSPRQSPFDERTDTLKQQALGSGFIVDAQGHVVTNAHVVDEAEVVKVTLFDEREFRAKVVGKDDRLDVAVLQMEHAPPDLPLAAIGSSDQLRVGEYVVAIGNPFGLGDTVTMGIVSAKGRSLGSGPYDDFIQTDASINPGNSGGPLFNLRGQVVGINAAINPQGKGIGFAIPIDAVEQVLPQLLATGHVRRGRIGAVVQGMDEDLAKAVGLDRPRGALVEEVEPKGPADKAGIESGDVILAVDGRDVPHSTDLPRMVASHAPGTTLRLTVMHDHRTKDVRVTLTSVQDELGVASPQGPGGSGPKSSFGFTVSQQDGHVVVDGVTLDGPADGKLLPGDVVEEVNRQAVISADELSARMRAADGKPVLIRVKRGNHSLYVAVEPAAPSSAPR